MDNKISKYIDQLRHVIQSQDKEIDKLEARVVELLEKLAEARELGLYWQSEAELGATLTDSGTGIEEPEDTITRLQVELADALLNKERKRHKKLQQDVSRFMAVLEENDGYRTATDFAMLFDKVREGK